jgi:hypothetical protein
MNAVILDAARLLVPNIKAATVDATSEGYSITIVSQDDEEYGFSIPPARNTALLRAAVVDELSKMIDAQIAAAQNPAEGA